MLSTWLRGVVAALAVTMLAVLSLAGLDRPFGNGDEVIYAQNVREMQRSGDLTTLTWQGQEVLQRPALPFVLAAGTGAIVPGERGLRLASALASIATLLALVVGAALLWESWAAGLLAAVLLAATPSFHLFSRALLSDPWFVAAATAALVSALLAARQPRWLIASGTALGLAFAFKSLAAAVPAVALAPALWGGVRAASRRTRIYAALAFAATALPFYAIGFAEHGSRFWSEHVGYSLWSRARGDLAVGMPGGSDAYFGYVARADGPLALWLVIALVGAAWIGARHRNMALIRTLAYAVVVGVVLSAIGTRLPHYLLPLYPAAALCAAGVVALGPRRPETRLPALALTGVLVVLAVVGAPLALVTTSEAEAHLLPAPEARDLGRAAGAAAAPGETVYTLDWYAPAVAYYADRPLVMLSHSRSFFEVVDDVDFIHAAGAVREVPPPPVPPGTSIVVAAPAGALEGIPWLRVEEILAAGPGKARPPEVVLVRARVIPLPAERVE